MWCGKNSCKSWSFVPIPEGQHFTTSGNVTHLRIRHADKYEVESSMKQLLGYRHLLLDNEHSVKPVCIQNIYVEFDTFQIDQICENINIFSFNERR